MKKTAVILLIAAILLLCSCGDRVKPTVNSADDISGKKVGVPENSISESFAKSEYPDCETVLYQSVGVMANDLAVGVIDCAICDSILADSVKAQNGLKVLGAAAGSRRIALVCARERADLLNVLNATLNTMLEDGTVEKIISGNTGGKAPVIAPDSKVYSTTLKLAVRLSGEPYAYYSDGILMGFEIDILRELCTRSGLGAEFSVMQGEDAISYVIAGKSDVAAGCLFESDGSSPLVLYSEPYYISNQVIITRK